MSTDPSNSVDGQPGAYVRILVAYDGSDNADRALSRAISIAQKGEAALTIVLVVPPSPYDEVLEDGRRVLGRAAEKARGSLSDVSEVLRDGQPADEILQLADDQEADLIVVGRRGLSAVERFFQGGVSSAVVAHSKCDVLVVR